MECMCLHPAAPEVPCLLGHNLSQMGHAEYTARFTSAQQERSSFLRHPLDDLTLSMPRN